jgi:hypothetical protein
VAYSNVPRWRVGAEVSGGTSMAAPQIAGAAALLLSGLNALGLETRAVDLRRALVTTAVPLAGTTVLDAGTGVAQVPSAFEWLQAAHQTGAYDIRAVAMGGNASRGSAALRRSGLASPGDTVQTFEVRSIGGQPAARLLLGSDVPWIAGPAVIEPGGAPITVRLTYDATALREPGVHVGTVWARPATDSLGGASFGLTNTVVVPQNLDRPFVRSGMLTPGAAARYFFDVPVGRSGLALDLTLADRTRHATLYLFEPDGAPHRGGSSVRTAGSGQAEMHVALEDLRPGTYEAVIVAPPSVSVAYELRASAPRLAIDADGTPPHVSIRNPEPVVRTGRVSAQVIGTRQGVPVEVGRAASRVVRVAVPEAAATMVLEVALTHELWRRLTDFGVTVFDAMGRKVSDGPLHYPIGRQSVPVETQRAGDTLLVELMPAFADVDGDHTWGADVQIDFLQLEPRSFEPLWAADGGFRLEPGATANFAFGVPTDTGSATATRDELIEIRIDLDDGSAITAHTTAENR